MDWNDFELEDDRLDPNKLFYSPYKQKEIFDYDDRGVIRGEDEQERLEFGSFCSSQVPQSEIEMRDFLQLSYNQISEFWTRHKERFVSFWRVMTPDARENFLRQVYPYIIQDLSDRYCWLDFKKQYRQDYEQILFLSPYLNVVDLSYQNHLINLLEKFSHANVLVEEASELVLRLRDLHAHNIYPFTSRESDTYARAIRIRRGDSLYMSDPLSLEFGEVVVVDNPRTVLLPTGGEAFRLYSSGHLLHQIEFQKVTENIAFIVTLLNDVLSTFTTEVLNRDASYLRCMTSLSLNTTTCVGALFEQDVIAAQNQMSASEGGKETPQGGGQGRGRGEPSSACTVQSLIRSHLAQLSAASSADTKT